MRTRRRQPLGWRRLIAVALLGLALSSCLWWAYFGGDDERAEEALMAAPPVRRSILAIQSYGYAHLALFAVEAFRNRSAARH